jgi:outer membrane murein-binding lipoprotein Lpp
VKYLAIAAVIIGVVVASGCALSVRLDEDSFSIHYQKIEGEAYE